VQQLCGSSDLGIHCIFGILGVAPRLAVAELTMSQTGFWRSRRTARYDPQRRVTAAAATPSRPETDPESDFAGSRLFRK
jgi:hypothetical protein